MSLTPRENKLIESLKEILAEFEDRNIIVMIVDENAVPNTTFFGNACIVCMREALNSIVEENNIGHSGDVHISEQKVH